MFYNITISFTNCLSSMSYPTTWSQCYQWQRGLVNCTLAQAHPPNCVQSCHHPHNSLYAQLLDSIIQTLCQLGFDEICFFSVDLLLQINFGPLQVWFTEICRIANSLTWMEMCCATRNNQTHRGHHPECHSYSQKAKECCLIKDRAAWLLM